MKTLLNSFQHRVLLRPSLTDCSFWVTLTSIVPSWQQLLLRPVHTASEQLKTDFSWAQVMQMTIYELSFKHQVDNGVLKLAESASIQSRSLLGSACSLFNDYWHRRKMKFWCSRPWDQWLFKGEQCFSPTMERKMWFRGWSTHDYRVERVMNHRAYHCIEPYAESWMLTWFSSVQTLMGFS